ncbi:hypothetical protein FOL47_002064 [Perkinsus chesapeaki]|uniref:Uncharacterized protein n=1 Tax=Perkinsus chesapeaki TaxID=330153 RepID=A0A7J6MG27_PERCH|nr:hypothetical protein FOL47_002064 [Perkinsus chesapeaki]
MGFIAPMQRIGGRMGLFGLLSSPLVPRGTSWNLSTEQMRWKVTKQQAYDKPADTSPFTRRFADKPHIGMKALSSEYVEASRIIVIGMGGTEDKAGQLTEFVILIAERIVIWENVVVTKTTSLKAAVSGRVKYTYDPEKERFYANVLPEPREELLRDDLWRYRTEFITSVEDNKLLIQLRQKAYWHIFPRPLVNPPQGVRVSQRRICLKDVFVEDLKVEIRSKVFLKNIARTNEKSQIHSPWAEHRMRGVLSPDTLESKYDEWNNPCIKDPLIIEPHPYPLKGDQLKKHLKGELQVTDPRASEFIGESAQR